MKKTIVFLLALLYHQVGASTVSRGPYVENFTEKSAVVRFRVNPSTVAWFSYGAFPDCERFSTFSGFTDEHKIRLNGLLSNTTHCYRIYLPVDNSTNAYKAFEGSFKTFKDENNSVLSFLIFGDSVNGNDEQKKLVVNMLKFDEVDFAVHTGNLTNTGLDIDADKEYFSIYSPLLNRIPVYISLGKKDYGPNFDNKDGAGFIKTNFSPYHTVPLNGLPPHYYFFDDAVARFIVLDGNYFSGALFSPSLKKGSKQYIWLENVLKNTSKKWKFVIIHQPIYSTGENSVVGEEREILSPIFEKYGVDIVFQGGDHNYERFKPIKESKPAEEGVIYVTIGGYNGVVGAKGEVDELSEVFVEKPHFAFLKIEGDKLEMNVYGPDEELIDSLIIEKR